MVNSEYRGGRGLETENIHTMVNKIMNKKVILGLLLATIICLGLKTPITYADNNTPFDTPALRSASEFDYPPFALVRPDGSADGFSVELLRETIHIMGLDVRIPVGPWHEIKQKLIEGELDVLPLVSYSPERDELFDFTVPYLRMHGAIFVRKGETSIHSKSDLKGKSVMVMRGDTAHEYAVQENLTDKLVLVDTYEKAIRLLSNGKHDAVVAQHLMGLQLIKKLGVTNIVSVSSIKETSLKPIANSLSGFQQKFCFAVHEGDAELLATLNEGLSLVIANGTYDRLYNKWFGPILPQPAIPWATVIKYMFFVLVPILLFVAIIGLWYLKKEVAQKTKSLRAEIVDRKKAEIALEHFAYSISHDLKNHAIGVQRLAEILRDRYGDTLDEEGKTYCDLIVKGTGFMQDLVDKINEYISAKEAKLFIEKISIPEIVNTVKEQFADQLNNQQVKWLESIKTPEIQADRLSLLRIYINLVSNSFKYGGSTLGEIVIGIKDSDDQQILFVKDNGDGLSEQDPNTVFGVFKRGESSVHTEGAGLGLAVVQEIAKRHNGRAWFESAADTGTTFYVSIAKELELTWDTYSKNPPSK
jgi:ABC-type amino acid transport substrate-binding protein/nitrogen-specific signal transduction histidine kinase